MIIHKEFIFVHLQKTGGSFIEKFLIATFPGCEERFPKHQSAEKVLKDRGSRFLFGSVRNPWAWYVSWWSGHRFVEHNNLFPNVFIPENKKDFNKFIKFIMTEDFGINHNISSKPLLKYNIGIYTYRYKFCFLDKGGNFLLDRIIFTEDLYKGLNTVFSLTSQQYDYLTSMKRVNTSNHKDYQIYYNDRSVELVNIKDKLIIDTYNYTFD